MKVGFLKLSKLEDFFRKKNKKIKEGSVQSNREPSLLCCHKGDNVLILNLDTFERDTVQNPPKVEGGNVKNKFSIIDTLMLEDIGVFCILYKLTNDLWMFETYKKGFHTPVFDCRVKPFDWADEEDISDFAIDEVCHDNKYLGVGTYVDTVHDGKGNIYGSSMYLRWTGEKYVYEIGSLDDWLAGEQDDEYEIVDGELKRKFCFR